MSKVYRGVRLSPFAVRVVVDDGTGERLLPPRNDLVNHSPDGFNWGYAGSGPTQLALALVADVLGDDELALNVYQCCKGFVLPLCKGARWTITEEYLRGRLDEYICDLRERHPERFERQEGDDDGSEIKEGGK